MPQEWRDSQASCMLCSVGRCTKAGRAWSSRGMDRVYCWEMSSSFAVELGKPSVVQHVVILQQPWHMSPIIEYKEKMTVGP